MLEAGSGHTRRWFLSDWAVMDPRPGFKQEPNGLPSPSFFCVRLRVQMESHGEEDCWLFFEAVHFEAKKLASTQLIARV